MKALVQDVLSVFSPRNVDVVFVRAGLSPREKELAWPMRTVTVSWVTSAEELNEAFTLKARAMGAVGYHITSVESHKTGKEQQEVMSATATLFNITEQAANS